MKKKIKYKLKDKVVERSYTYIPVRYIFAVLITVLEVAAIIGVVVALCWFVPYFYVLAYLTQIGCVLKIIASDDNPDYKVPWLLFVLILPIVGFMLYFIFASRTLKKKYVKRLNDLKEFSYNKDDDAELLAELNEQDDNSFRQAKMVCNISGSHLFKNTKQKYFPDGESMWKCMLEDLKNSEKFIYMEYFIIEEGEFWNSILDVLKEKSKAGVEVKVVYDDIGCMMTLPGDYAKQLAKFGIEATPFSRLKGSADSEFNNRNHRKITVIDGKIGYTGGINIADEYINRVERFGYWKDTGIRLEGEAVWELTKLFLVDFGINVKTVPQINNEIYPKVDVQALGYVIPFGDGPSPLYNRRVGKSVIQNMLSNATKYAYMTSPYLIIDNDLCQSIESAALRGVDVRIIVPHVPDKKLIFSMTKSFYDRLMSAGVKIYEYEPGFIHAKSYLVDDVYGMIGTINLDYRSLVHHFENGVWMFNTDCLQDLKADIIDTMSKSIEITPEMKKINVFQKLWRSFMRIFAPLM